MSIEKGTTPVAEAEGPVVRKATLEELDAIKSIADSNKDLIGFVLRPALAENISRQWVLVAEIGGQIIGFANYRHRRDHQTTLYEICVATAHRGNGVGKELMTALYMESRNLGQRCVRLKCPVNNAANVFYERLGFVRVGEEAGKRRALAIWEYRSLEDDR